MIARSLRSRRAFTLIEIMIVVSIVTILSWLALVAITRIKDKAARAAIANNLRQLYQAKEFYYSETGSTQQTSITELANGGYIRPGLNASLTNPHSFEAGQHWHYQNVMAPSKPTSAYRGTSKPSVAAVSENEIYYPGLPEDPANYWNAASAGATAAPATAQAPAQPPVVAGPPVPAGMKVGSNPLAPWVPSNAPLVRVAGFGGSSTGNIMLNGYASYLKAQSPDGSPVHITGLRVEGATVSLNRPDGTASVRFDSPGTGTARAWVTVDNGHGQNEIEVYIQR